MAHKKGVGSSKNGRESESKRLGVKVFGGQFAKAGNINHPYLQENGSTKKGIITISSNRGLAGGYNNNIVKLIRDSGMNKEDIMIYAVGHKAMDTLKHRGYEIVSDDSEMINEPVYDDARILGEKLLKAFEAVSYTHLTLPTIA